MGNSLFFNSRQDEYLREALEIAEMLASRRYCISSREWGRYPYDIKTLRQLRSEEITDRGFAQLAKYSREGEYHRRKGRIGEFYRICVQDHIILNALERSKNISLRPLLLYITTHELVHIVRFSHYEEDYDIYGEEREKEEGEVHNITYDLLKNVNYDGMEEVINVYEWARTAPVS